MSDQEQHQSALDYACALGRLCGGWPVEVLWCDPPVATPDRSGLEVVKDRAILEALRACLGNRAAAARRLGISRSTIYEHLKAGPREKTERSRNVVE